jgi:hypothetical protein
MISDTFQRLEIRDVATAIEKELEPELTKSD